jgi:glycosyltransferase involved in cell wall biosynthesis
MKIVICWSNYTGYWASCWRELIKQSGVELFVVAFRQPVSSPFGEELLDGVPHRLLDEAERNDSNFVRRLVAAEKPDIIQVVGWFVRSYRAVVLAPELADCRKFMCVDTPFLQFKQLLTRIRYRRYFRHIDGVGVTGERSWQYVTRLGFPSSRVRRHMYGVDEHLANEVYHARAQNSGRRGFLFVGRYSPEKGLDVLVEAYRLYRSKTDAPWDLICCGNGVDGHLLKDQEGVINMGFVSPLYIADHFREARAYVASSRFDSWPLAIVEAAMSGLPIIATDACGCAVEIVRPNYNGLIIPAGDPEALAEAMLQMQSAPIQLWGDRAREHALPFTSELWAKRWLEFFSLDNEDWRSLKAPHEARMQGIRA